MKCYVFDIDGTLADLTHRLPLIRGNGKKDWEAFFDACDGDAPIVHVVEVMRALRNIHPVICVSGRTDRVKDKTLKWLAYNAVVPDALYMRTQGDFRQDYIIKRELLDRLRADGYEPVLAFDDRDQVVKMWRENGVPCAQVAEGDF